MKHDKAVFGLDSELLPTIDGKRLGSRNRIRLLEYIAEYGSIAQAAKAVPMTYKAAWDAVDAMNNLAPEPLVVRSSGGKGGGSSLLSDFGRELIAQYRHWEAQHQRMWAVLQQQTSAQHWDLWQRWNMKFSADNQLFGRVTEIVDGAVNSEVQISLPSGQTLTAIITQASCRDMELHIGSEVFALIQSSAIIVATIDDDTAHFSARNQLRGSISRIQTGSVNSIISVHIGKEITLTAAITCQSCEGMQLAEGKEVLLLIKAGSVVLGCV